MNRAGFEYTNLTHKKYITRNEITLKDIRGPFQLNWRLFEQSCFCFNIFQVIEERGYFEL